MRSSRAVVLMGILLLLLVGYLSRGMWINYVPLLAGPDGPRPSSNSVTNLRVALEADGQWHARFDYGYTGEPEYAMFRIVEVHGLQREGGPESSMPTMRPAVIGSHSIDQIISRPQGDDPQFTHSVDAALVKNGTSVTAAKVNVTIEWPSSTEATFLSFTKGRTPGQIVDMAADLIDTGGRRNIERANEFLDRVVEKNPQVDTAYIELARVRMKLNWGSEGLAQAEKVLDTAMKIKPGDNARILLGYVYAHQGRYREAEMLFAKAAESNPPNTWLWMNWGESFQMQGKEDAAIAMYRKALAHPVTQAGYDKARQQAYQFLLPILEARNDYDGQETLYRSQAAEYGYGLCNGPAYAVFMLRHRGNAAAAIDIAHKTGNSQCPAYDVREILGVANYVLWSTSSDPDKQTSWNKARAYMPASARLFYQLAKSDSLANVARELVRANDAVDMPDNNRMNALAYALRERDVAAARRLLRLGARPQAPVGPEEMPVALLPVVLGDSDAVRMLRKAGVDYTKLRFRGMTALDHAKSVADQKMIKALEQGESV